MWTSTSLRLSLLSLRLETRRRRRGSSSNPPAATRGRRRRLLLQEVTVQVALRPAQPARLGGRCCRGRPGTRGSSAPPRLAPPPVTNSPGASRACRRRPSCTGCRRTASTSCCGPRWATFAAARVGGHVACHPPLRREPRRTRAGAGLSLPRLPLQERRITVLGRRWAPRGAAVARAGLTSHCQCQRRADLANAQQLVPPPLAVPAGLAASPRTMRAVSPRMQ